MSWTQKALKKHSLKKKIEQAMQSPEYKQVALKGQIKACERAYVRMCLVACDYLQIKHNYGEDGIRQFLEYASEVVTNTLEEDKEYFDNMNNVMIDECGVDVLKTLGFNLDEDSL